ncbi:NBS-containing resistance-like protein [Trifolium medium]|uniref:NBS-containing resistance-like protein n=1 Tax=Trifolium medium TaxID=97028 RepID=A0A392MRK8_9FABA|nr:NBS-containing resistance-like protein [Trifolium medium]
MSSFTFSSNSPSEFESTSSTYPDPSRKRYDVYLSFCDEDACSFVVDTYASLTSPPRIAVFSGNLMLVSDDDQILLRPSESTLNVIGECKIAIIVLSKNYTNSSWCLRELEKITECCRTSNGLIVLPFLYPPNIRLRVDMFGEAFLEFLDRISTEETSEKADKFMSWVAAISHYTGYISKVPEYFKDPYPYR